MLSKFSEKCIVSKLLKTFEKSRVTDILKFTKILMLIFERLQIIRFQVVQLKKKNKLSTFDILKLSEKIDFSVNLCTFFYLAIRCTKFFKVVNP